MSRDAINFYIDFVSFDVVVCPILQRDFQLF